MTVAEIEARPYPKEKLLPYTWYFIDEVEIKNWGIGGKTVTPEVLKAVMEGKT